MHIPQLPHSANRQTLTSLAMLKVNADVSGTDYLEYIVPFIRHILGGLSAGSNVTVPRIQSSMREVFGLAIPQAVIESVLKRLRKRGELRLDSVYYVGELAEWWDLTDNLERQQLRNEQLLAEIADYARTNLSLVWTEADAERALLQYAAVFGIECLAASNDGSIVPTPPETASADLIVIHSYVMHVHEKRLRSELEALTDIVKGHMLASALLCEDLAALPSGFTDLVVYFDTTFILQLLGLHGREEQMPAVELCELLRAQRVGMAVLSHTLEETESVLRFAVDRFDDLKQNPPRVIRAARSEGRTRSDLQLALAKLEPSLREANCRVVQTPDYSRRALQIDERQLEEYLSDEIQYASDQAKYRDINSVRAMYVLRRGYSTARLERAKAVFVTTNTALARAAKAYSRNNVAGRVIPPAITALELTTYLWLKSPMKKPDLPQLQVVTACYAALQPSDDLWNRYIREIDRLLRQGTITAEDHQLLRASPDATRALVELTQGSDAALQEATMEEIMERTRAGLLPEKEREIARLRGEKEAAQRKADQVASERAATGKALDGCALFVARGASWLLVLVLTSLVALALFGKWPAVLTAAVIAGLDVVGLYTEVKIPRVRRWLEGKLHRWLASRLRQRFLNGGTG